MTPSDPPKSFDDVIHAVATLQVTLDKIHEAQGSVKADLKRVFPRLDALDAQVKVLAAEVRDMGERTHRLANLITPLVDEAGVLAHATNVLQAALELSKHESTMRATFERLIDVVETRAGHLRAELAEVLAGSPSSEKEMGDS